MCSAGCAARDVMSESIGADSIRVVDSLGRVFLVAPAPAQTLAQVFFLEGLWPDRPFCAGLGRCGLCMVRYISFVPEPLADEEAVLSSQVLEKGGRLACRRMARPGLHIELPFVAPHVIRAAPMPLSRAIQGPLSMAVDLGTTSLHWQVRDERGVLAQGQELNPQLAVGSEVMSRMGFALASPRNAQFLREVVLQRLDRLTAGLPEPVQWLCVAGNTVMTALLLGWPVRGLAAAPYTLPHKGGLWVRLQAEFQEAGLRPKMRSRPRTIPEAEPGARPEAEQRAEDQPTLAPGSESKAGTCELGPDPGLELGLDSGLDPGLDPGWAYIPPLPAPFLGGDLSAGLVALHFGQPDPPEYPYLLADLGTNGEFILALGPDRFLAASVPLGPALEGIGMRCGSTAMPGVWVDFQFSAQGLRPVAMPFPDSIQSGMEGAQQPLDARRHGFANAHTDQRISGTGYLALLSGLRRLGLVSEDGRFVEGQHPLARRIGQAVVEVNGQRCFQLNPDVLVTGHDVEEVLKVKAAFHVAFSRLLQEARLDPGALKAMYLCGALGEHVATDALEELGFVPLGMHHKMHALGNTSLIGAALLARCSQAREWIEQVVPCMTTLAIGQEDDFLQQFLQRLVFRHA
jgi:uncharacterized 2Fe-2S/4Fe-4S cluster protein (DUF4445 family)